MKKYRMTIYILGFLFNIAIGITAYINSSFLGDYLNKAQVSMLFVFGSIISILILLETPRFLIYLGNRITLILSSILFFISLILLAVYNQIFIIIPAFILYFITLNLIIASLDIFLEDFSKINNVGQIRGLFLMFANSAWIIAELISGFIIAKHSFSGIYIFSSGIIILAILILLGSFRNFKDPIYEKINIIRTIKTFLQNKNILRIYFSNLILRIFFVWMVIYTPVYLFQYMKFPWEQIGIMFAIMLVPFVVLDFPLGKLSDAVGEKKMLIIGFIIIIISNSLIPFLKEQSFFVFTTLLFLTRIGAATIEIMNESYFFKSINKKDADLISFFRNTFPISYIIGPSLGIITLALLPNFKGIFFVLSFILFLGLIAILKLKDIK